jgi:hypothetical protein
MTRLFGTVVVLLCVTTAAHASLATVKDQPRTDGLMKALARDTATPTEKVAPPAQVELTEETEVMLDGKKCQYKDVPATASVAELVLARDGKTVVRIEFRSK